ncbi:50S ribosome-binding GTPase family protein [Gigaspora margarita]|uniref:50S ribosome-binding GTPase family protein n=1 Tax=Gigaspora margarita TaxID=4874 RepID=A0A8H4EPU5_GIGMA|nr:50S ribosome-binding GTPase family protein [Gigaspora margarita]
MLLKSGQEIEEIQHHFNEINERISQQEKAIIIIGDTGEGKSTLLNYLTGVPLFSRDDDFGDYIIYTETSDGIDINDRSISQTTLPLCRGIYWDCPGFGDTRGPVQNIINAYSIYKLVKNTKKLKVVVVASEYVIKSTRKKEFLNLINNIGETFKNTDELVQGLCLVITKNNKLDAKKVRTCFHKILEEQIDQENFGQSKRKILKFLSSSESQIIFFNAPQQEGRISDTDKSSILEGIEKISYLKKLEPNLLLDDGPKLYIKDLVEKFHVDIKNYILLKFYPAVQSYLETLIDTHLGTIKELRNILFNISDQLNNIHEKPQHFENNLQQILLIVEFIQRNDLKEELLKKFSLLNFFNLVKPESLEIKGNTSSWYDYISELIKEIDVLKSFKVYSKEHLLTLEGIIIGTEDLINVMNNQEISEISEINMFSLNTLFIDKDIIAPGVNLSLISPKLRVVGKRTINLKGNSGPLHQPNKANDGISFTKERIYNEIYDEVNEGISSQIINNSNDKIIFTKEKINDETNNEISSDEEKIEEKMNGKDGLPGQPGYNGGNFYVKGSIFFDLSSLIINVSGGDGGQGQDGGDGAKGFDGADCGVDFIKQKKILALISREKMHTLSNKESGVVDKAIVCTKFLLTFNDKHEETYEYFDPGQKGGNGGRGGIGGIGGNPGSVEFDSPSQLIENPIILKECKRGADGKRGNAGRGGKNGPKYRGVYINERVLPALRGYKEFSSESNELDPQSTVSDGVMNAMRAVPAASSAVAKVALNETAKESAKVVTENAFLSSFTMTSVKETLKRGSSIFGFEAVGSTMQVAASSPYMAYIGNVGASLKQGSNYLIKDVLKIGASESTKQIATVGSVYTGAVGSFGVSLAAQGVFSTASAYLSSYWKEEPHKIEDNDEFALDGKSFDELNEVSIKTPSDQFPLVIKEKEKLYKQFYDKSKNHKFVKELLYLERTTY